MCDLFDLKDGLESPNQRDEIENERCSCEVMGVQDWLFNIDEGIDMVVSPQPKTVQHVATLVVLVNKWKKIRQRTDEQPCSLIMDSLVDEKVVNMVQGFTTLEKKKRFQRVNSVSLCTLCDTSQKDVVQPLGDLKLQAITLKGGSSQQKVTFKLSRYITPFIEAKKTQAVALSIMNSNWYISCHMKEGTAVLHLECCCDEDLNVVTPDGNMDRFLFYKIITGLSLITFESVKYPGWVISTSSDAEDQPVEMCKANNATRLICFKEN